MIRKRILSWLGAALLAAGVMVGQAATPASAASLVEVTNFGTNPSGLRMHLYVPDGVGSNPAVVVAVHYCTGTGPAFYSGTDFARLADQYKFIVIYPSATRSGQCFDVYTAEALRRNGGSDPVGIRSMVGYVQQRYNADSNRIYVTGASSGAMMTNVLLGDYPDVFKAGAAFMGVPATCFATTPPNTWNSDCANGNVIKSAQQWGDAVRNMYPGYSGARPRMQVWHGTTDPTLRYPNFGEEIKQWTNVLGVSQTPSSTDTPQSGWTRTRYGGTGTTAPVEAISVNGVGHSLPMSGMAAMAIAFFGLNSSTPPPDDPPSDDPPPTGGPCAVEYTVSSWNTGLTANIKVTNATTAAVSGWTLRFTLPSGQTVTSSWGASYSPTSGAVTATPASYNATIGAGGSVSFGFQANHTGNAAEPTSFALNGTTCTVA
ncbi:extracellular catalytic domain type 1 short-chain-length polyhydroxyalkanoate depolymerase [Actinophytocola oryzae]|uniref:Poly(Hydroxyalkanoate) depolymerase family esterase n=1 Tax=Actinophytocola oryzae TaxID=502181 RepID=A0A4V6Q6N1_9PSEU|nr:PHB depolymerase family esterase [Actinophytocola oryzae]TDV44941.1 poly(hydroxyalkanoate) depolymerase family esterase [Actinophytocola oryzae]